MVAVGCSESRQIKSQETICGGGESERRSLNEAAGAGGLPGSAVAWNNKQRPSGWRAQAVVPTVEAFYSRALHGADIEQRMNFSWTPESFCWEVSCARLWRVENSAGWRNTTFIHIHQVDSWTPIHPSTSSFHNYTISIKALNTHFHFKLIDCSLTFGVDPVQDDCHSWATLVNTKLDLTQSILQLMSLTLMLL